MPTNQRTTKFIRNKVIIELCDRSIPGIPAYIAIWLLLGGYYNLNHSEFSNFYYWALLSIILSSIFRILTLVWIKKTPTQKNFHLKLSVLQTSLIVTGIIMSSVFIYVICTPELSNMHIVTIIIALSISISSPIAVSINRPLRLIIISVYFLSASCAIALSSIDNKYVLSSLALILFFYVQGFSKKLYENYWKTLISEIALKNQVKKTQLLANKLQILSQTDSLTQLYNRLYFEQNYRQEWKRAMRQGYPLSILLLDIDHFKKINDTLGHSFGDYCLRKFSETLKYSMRRSDDIIARYGGEEFIILMPNTNNAEAIVSAKRILNNVRKNILHTADGFQLNLTCCIGVATNWPQHTSDLSPDELINHADIALYSAKETGRDKLAVFEQPVDSETEMPATQNNTTIQDTHTHEMLLDEISLNTSALEESAIRNTATLQNKITGINAIPADDIEEKRKDKNSTIQTFML